MPQPAQDNSRNLLHIKPRALPSTQFLLHYSLNTFPDLANIYIPEGPAQDELDKTVQLKSKIQHNGTRSAASWPPRFLSYAQHHSSTIFVSSTFHFRNESTGFPKIWEQPQIYGHQNGDMNKTSYGGQTNIRRHVQNLVDLAPRICATLPSNRKRALV